VHNNQHPMHRRCDETCRTAVASPYVYQRRSMRQRQAKAAIGEIRYFKNRLQRARSQFAAVFLIVDKLFVKLQVRCGLSSRHSTKTLRCQ
jgi:hypothetical protein